MPAQAVARLALAFSPEDRPPFSLITQELASTYHKMSSKQASAGGAGGLLTAVSRQLTATWVGLLGRVWATPAGAAAAGAQAGAPHGVVGAGAVVPSLRPAAVKS